MTEHAHADAAAMTGLTIGVLALQGAFVEHIRLLQTEAAGLQLELSQNKQQQSGDTTTPALNIIPVRTTKELDQCAALVIPGGESTSIALIAARTNLLTPLRDFVKVARKPVWGTCAGLILLAEVADRTKSTGQELIGGLDVRVRRNYFGRQVESFEADLDLPFLGPGDPRFHSVFIRAPVVEEILATNAHVDESADGTVTAPRKQEATADVEILARLPGRARALKDRVTTAEELGEDGDIVAVKQGNVFGTAFHPELTGDGRIHRWWLGEVLRAANEGG